LGLAFAVTYTELYERNRNRAESFRTILNESNFATGDDSIQGILKKSDEEHQKIWVYRWGRRMTGSGRRFWFLAPSLIMIGGIVLSLYAW
jgi:hypothetical protein